MNSTTVRTIDIPQAASLLTLLHQYRTTHRGQVILHLPGGTANVMLIAVRDGVTHAPTNRAELRVHLDLKREMPERVTEDWMRTTAAMLGLTGVNTPRPMGGGRVWNISGTLAA